MAELMLEAREATAVRRTAVHAAEVGEYTAHLDAAGAAVIVLDIAWDRPTIARIKATGASGVMRYFSPDTSKNLTEAEVRDYTVAGLRVGTVFESTAGRATQGRAAGVADAKLAEVQREAVGLPATHIHHFAVDEDTSWASVQAYFDGAASVVSLARQGCYGGFRVVEGAYGHGIRFLWQTVAWSGGEVSAHATLYQTGATALAGAADVNHALAADFGQFPRPVAPPPPHPSPAPAPAPLPRPVPQFSKETHMIMVTVARPGTPDGPPTGTPWPGDFLLADGRLSFIATPADEASFRAAGITGPVHISWKQYESLLAGK